MWRADKAIKGTADRCPFSFWSLQQSTLPVVPGWSITFKAACFPLPGYHSAWYPCGEGEILAIYRRHPLVLPCPVHGPIWAKLQWMHVILRCSCVCLASPRTPLGGKFNVVGWQQGHLALLALDRAQKWRSTHSLSPQHRESVFMEWKKSSLSLLSDYFNQIRHDAGLKVWVYVHLIKDFSIIFSSFLP